MGLYLYIFRVRKNGRAVASVGDSGNGGKKKKQVMLPVQIVYAICVVLLPLYAVQVAIHDTFEYMFCPLYVCPIHSMEICIFGRQACRSAYNTTGQSAATGGVHNACGKRAYVRAVCTTMYMC